MSFKDQLQCRSSAPLNNSEFDHFSKNTQYTTASPPAAMKVQNQSQHQQSLSDRIDQFFAEVSNKVWPLSQVNFLDVLKTKIE